MPIVEVILGEESWEQASVLLGDVKIMWGAPLSDGLHFAVFALQTFQNDSDFFFRIEFAAGSAFDFYNHRFWTFTGFRYHRCLLSRFRL